MINRNQQRVTFFEDGIVRIKYWCSIFLMLFFISACEYADNTDDTKEDAQVKSQPAVINIGAVLPLTGSASMYGDWVKKGIEIAIKHLEEDYPGADFKVSFQDDQNKTAQSVNALNKLIHFDKIPIVIGSVTSTTTTAIAPIAQKNKTLLISPSSSAVSLSAVGDYFFRVWSSDDFASRELAHQITTRFSPKRLAIIYANNDYGQGVLQVLRDVLPTKGIEIVAEEGYQLENRDFRSHLTRIKLQEPDLILLVGYASELSYAVKNANELGVNVQLVGQEGIESQELLDIAGDAAEGLVYFVPQFDSDDSSPKVNRFVEDYKKNFNGSVPEVFAAHGYDAMRVVGEAIVYSKLSGLAVRDVLEEVTSYKGITGMIDFDTQGNVEKPLVAKIVQGKKFLKLKE